MNKISIIIPTHNRSHLLTRAIQYYSKFTECEFIICDSSEQKYSNSVFNFRYFHLPNLTFAQKLLYGVEKSNCGYICLSADDDFLFESSLKKGYRFLTKNKTYVSVHGYFSEFSCSKNKLLFNDYAYPQNKNFQPNQEEIASRIIYSMNPYMQLLYSLHPKNVTEECLKFASNFPEITNVEIAFSIISLIYGKHKTLNVYWMARDNSVYTNYTTDVNNKNSVINDYNYYLETESGQKFKKEYALYYSEINNIKIANANIIFEKIFSSYSSYLKALNSRSLFYEKRYKKLSNYKIIRLIIRLKRYFFRHPNFNILKHFHLIQFNKVEKIFRI